MFPYTSAGLYETYQSLSKLGTMPETLKIAIISPLLKKINADHNNFSSFHPVSNLKFLWKLIEKAVFAQLNEYLIATCTE